MVFGNGSAALDNRGFEEELRVLAHQLGVADAVDNVGSTNDVPSILETLDILLVPSWEEPFGRVVVEGMAAGVPVIATAVGDRPR